MRGDSNKYKPPEASVGDHAHAVVRAALGGPMGVAIEAFEFVVNRPVNRRLSAWRIEVGEALLRLEAEKGLTLEDLQRDEGFIDIVIQASQVAVGNSQKEKRTALRNAIMNTALASSDEDERQRFFIRLIDEFSALHLRVLKIYSDPLQWAKESGKDMSSILIVGDEDVELAEELAFPDHMEHREFYKQIWRDLFLRGLVVHDKMSVVGFSASKHIAQLGYEFLRYIEEPE